MKKLIVLLSAILAVAFVAPAFAADNLELSGQFRVRGWDITDGGYVDGNDSSWFDQRMRLKAKINANDNAYVIIRGDLGDTTWGSGFKGGIQRPGAATGNFRQAVDFDRLYGVLDRDMFTLKLGQQYLGLGIGEVLDANMVAANLRLKLGAVEPSFIYGKIDENGSTNDDGTNDDTDIYAINLSFGLGGFDANVFGAMIENNATDADPWALGINASGALGVVNLVAEVATFGGDDGMGCDYVGTQAYLKGSANVSDTVTVGAELLYAIGTDDSDEMQITNLVDWWTFTPMSNNTPGDADFSATGSDPFDLGSQFGEDGAGSQGITVFAEVSAMENLSLGGKIGYFSPEEDDATDLDAITAFNAWVTYKVGPNTSASLVYLQVSPDFDSSSSLDDEDEKTIYAKFAINF